MFSSVFDNICKISKQDVLLFLKQYPRYCNRRLFAIHFPELYSMIDDAVFPREFSRFAFPQKLYHFLNDDFKLEIGYCKTCGKRCSFKNIRNGYSSYCSGACCLKNDNVIKRRVSTKFSKNNGHYRSEEENKKISTTYRNKTDEEKQETISKREKTHMDKYGVQNAMQSEPIKNKVFSKIKLLYGGIGNGSKQIKAKQENTMCFKYGVSHNWKSDDTFLNGKHTRKLKYGSENYFSTQKFKNDIAGRMPEIVEKGVSTKRKNHTFNTSNIEEEFARYLEFIGKTFIRQYSDDRYPFCCDFYFPDENLFLEINGTWTHGGKPFEGTVKDMEQLEKWKAKDSPYYGNAIETWTVRDVKKRKHARENNLNHLEVFSTDLDEIIKIIKPYLNDNKDNR